jgi:hypothetical protein
MDIKAHTEKTQKGILALNKQIEAAVFAASREVGMVATAEMKKQITGGHKMGTPTPSAPNTPPTNVTGNLRQSIRSNVKKGFTNQYTVTVGAYMIYARALEHGHPDWESGLKYPFVEPTGRIMATNNRARNIYINALRHVLDK